jgi:glycosyltransferase involved in cell wall biosynthesis
MSQPEAKVPLEGDFRKVWWPEQNVAPLVSIVCVTYNHRGYIQDALDGFLMQKTTFPFEIIVHDDVSTDGTIDVLEEQARRHPEKFVLILRNSNVHSRGQSATFHALKHARGKYVALCEGDDFWTDAGKLQRQVDFMEAHPDFAVCYHRFYPCTVRGKIGYALPQRIKNPECNADGQKRKPGYMTTATVLFRNVPDLLPPELHLSKFRDNFIFAMLGNHGKSMYLEDIGPTGYRLHEGGIFSLTSDAQKKMDRITTFYWIAVAFEKHAKDKSAAWYWRYRAARILTGASGSAWDEIRAGLSIAWYAFRGELIAPFSRLASAARYGWARLTGKKLPKAIVFGASKGGANAYKNLRHAYDVVAFADNDAKKHEGRWCGRPIVSPDAINGMAFDIILVASTYRWQILEQLQRQYGIPIEKIMVVPPGMVVA